MLLQGSKKYNSCIAYIIGPKTHNNRLTMVREGLGVVIGLCSNIVLFTVVMSRVALDIHRRIHILSFLLSEILIL